MRRPNLRLVQLPKSLVTVRTGERRGAAASTVASALEAAAVLTRPARTRASGTKVLITEILHDQFAVKLPFSHKAQADLLS